MQRNVEELRDRGYTVVEGIAAPDLLVKLRAVIHEFRWSNHRAGQG